MVSVVCSCNMLIPPSKYRYPIACIHEPARHTLPADRCKKLSFSYVIPVKTVVSTLQSPYLQETRLFLPASATIIGIWATATQPAWSAHDLTSLATCQLYLW